MKLFKLSILFLFFTSCVSKKKLNEANQKAETKASEKAVLEEVLNKLAVENDSLTQLVLYMDSLYRSEREKTSNSFALTRGGEKINKLKKQKSQITEKEEYKNKAIFVISFLADIYWPETTTETFNIGIVGNSPIFEQLTMFSEGKTVHKHSIKIESYAMDKSYHVLFFSEGGLASFNKIKKQAALLNSPVLMITENVLIENIGSHITLFVDGTKVKYHANKKLLDQTKLKVSPSFYNFASNQ